MCSNHKMGREIKKTEVKGNPDCARYESATLANGFLQ